MAFVYTLNDPTTDQVRYVGKTIQKINERLNQHFHNKNGKLKDHRSNWVNSLKLMGRKLSEEHKKNISLSGKGKKHSEATKQKMRLARLGKSVSKETRKKISDTLKSKMENNK